MTEKSKILRLAPQDDKLDLILHEIAQTDFIELGGFFAVGVGRFFIIHFLLGDFHLF